MNDKQQLHPEYFVAVVGYGSSPQDIYRGDSDLSITTLSSCNVFPMSQQALRLLLDSYSHRVEQ